MIDLTVIMATRNSAPFVSQALESITNQAYESVEILVIDADSTDGTQELVCKVPNTRLERQTGLGLWQAWNQAIQQISTPYIAMIDSDDLWEPDSIAVHMTALSENPKAVASIGLTRFFSDAETLPSGVRRELLEGSHRGAVPGATMYRREVFEMLGYFLERFTTTADIEWFLRLRQSNLMVEKPHTVVLAKRIHADNLSGTFPTQNQYDQDLIQIARESIQRKAKTAQKVLP